MLFRVGIALFLSVVIIGGATWMRLSNSPKEAPTLLAVADPSNPAESLEKVSLVGDSTQESGPLTTTDLVSRQLILEYLDLATSNTASEENVLSLVDKYVDGLEGVQSAPKITLANLSVVDNTKANFQAYDLATDDIEIERITKVNAIYKSSDAQNLSNANLYKLSADMGSAFEVAANDLQNISVPQAVATLHLRLVNSYLSVAHGLKAMASAERDSTLAFAGMINASSSTEESKTIIEEIMAVMLKNGL